MSKAIATQFHERVYSMGSSDIAHIDGDFVDFPEGDAEPVVQVTVDVGGESLCITFDGHHLRELRLILQRAERWVAKEKAREQAARDAAEVSR